MTMACSSHALLLIHAEARTPSSSDSAKEVVIHAEVRITSSTCWAPAPDS